MATRIEVGRALVYSQAIRSKMGARMARIIKAMQRDVKAELLALFRDDVYKRQVKEVATVAMDASVGDVAAALMARMMAKWQPLFDREADSISKQMVDASLAHSDTTLGASLKDLSKSLTLQVSPALQVMIDASTQESTALIKRVPAEYLPNVQQDVMRSITTGNGLADLVPALEKRNVKVRNWAVNVARDQTRKAYANINNMRIREAGIRKFKWLHSGGSNQPRPYHMHRWPAGLNGGIFSYDDPPVIDESTGERGLPGTLPFCGCTASPVIELEENNE